MILDKFIIISLYVFGTIASALDESKFAKILKYEFTKDPFNSYFYQYENSDGQSKEEKGENADSFNFIVRGSYSYPGADGITYTVNYFADKDGFHPSGDHIKIPPYIPWPVNRILSDESDGQYHPDPHPAYLPSSEKPPIIPNDFSHTILTKTQPSGLEIPSTTPQPPLPTVTVTNAYIPPSPSPPTVKIQGHSQNSDFTKTRFIAGTARNDRNPYRNYNQLSNAYITSSASPSINSVRVTPPSYIGADASTPIPSAQSAAGGRRGRGRNLAAYRKAQNDLFEVIQNNHSSQGVFKDV